MGADSPGKGRQGSVHCDYFLSTAPICERTNLALEQYSAHFRTVYATHTPHSELALHPIVPFCAHLCFYSITAMCNLALLCTFAIYSLSQRKHLLWRIVAVFCYLQSHVVASLDPGHADLIKSTTLVSPIKDIYLVKNYLVLDIPIHVLEIQSTLDALKYNLGNLQ